MTESLNLVPLSFRRRLLFRRRLRQWCGVWLLCAIALGSAAIGEYSHVVRLRNTLMQREQQCKPLHETEQDTERVGQQLAEVRERSAFLTTLQHGDRPAQLLGFIGRFACLPKHSIHLVECNLSTTGLAVSTRSTSAPQGITGRRLLLKGIAVDDLAVARFVSALREAELFDNVRLQSSIDAVEDSDASCRFEVTCEYR